MKKLNLFKSLFSVLVLLLGVGNAWGHDTDHYGQAKLTNATGNGTVYLSTSASSQTGQTGASNAGKKDGYSYINWNCGKSAEADDKTVYAIGTPNAGYYWKGWAESNTATSYTATATGKTCTATGTSSSSRSVTNLYGFFKPVTVTGAPANVNINATDPLTTYPDAGGAVLSFTTANSNKIEDFTTAANGDARWVISAWTRASASSTTFNYKFVGNGSYGTNNRTLTKTVTLTSKGDASSTKTCTLTAKYPNPRVIECNEGATDLTIYPTFKAADATQAAVEKTAVFDVVYADNANNFTAAFSGATGSGTWTVTGISVDQANQKATVTYTFNGNKAVGTHTAVLTLTANNCQGWDDTSADGGASATVTLTAENTQEATDDAKVTAADGTTVIYQGDWATAWTKANTAANAGCTLQVLRNVTGGSLNANQKVTNTFTLDLNGKILSANYNGSIIYLNTAGKTLTIKDSKTGGRIENVNNAYAGMAIIVNAEKGNLIFESGTLYCENKGASGRRAVGIYNQAGTTVTMNGGKIEVHGYNNSQGVLQTSNKNNNTSFTMNGGEIEVDGYQDIYGVSAPGKVNINDGTINVTATYSNCRGITLSAAASATAANCYWGTLTMKGGTINSTCTANADGTRYAYGIVLEGSYTASMGTGVATDGSHANKAASTGTIENATINVSTLGRYAYGVLANGSYQSKTNHYDVIQIKNTKIDVTSQYYYTYGVYANCGINGTNGGIYAANIELTNCDVTATTTKNHTAYAVWAVATATTIYKNAQPNYYGEYAGGATITVNSGTYTANTGTTNAYAIGTSARAKTTYDSESNVTAERKLGGNAEGYATLNIHGGIFRANAGSTTARAVSNGGDCTIDGGEFYATAGSSTADGIYTVSGKLKASGVKIEASATGTVYGVRVDAANVPYNTDAAWTGFNYAGDAELNNLDVTVTARTGATAYGVYLNAVSYQYTQSAFDTYMQGRIDAGKVTQANADIWAAVFPGNSSYAIAGKAVINGGKYTVRAATTGAYGLYAVNRAVANDKAATAAVEMDVKNVKLDVKTNGTTSAVGIRTAGPSTVDGADIKVNSQTTTCYGMIICDVEPTTVTNTKIDASGTTTVYGIFVNASAPSTTNGYDWHGKAILGDGNDVTAAATSGNTSYAVYLHSNKAAVASGEFAGNYANGGEALITGGKYKATATGTTAYGICLNAQTLQGDVYGRPKCEVTGGKFWGKATGGTDGAVNGSGVQDYFVLKGGVYNVNTNLSTYIPEGYEEIPLTSDRPEYTEGYRYEVDEAGMHGIDVCKIGSTKYKTLEEALQVVTSGQTIIMIANYTMATPGDYVLPAGATLLVPYSGQTAAKTTSLERVYGYTKPAANLKLSFGAGVNLDVLGTIEAGSKQAGSGQTGGYNGAPHLSYGWIYLAEGSTMTLENGAKLFAWGYVTGTGEIDAKRGSTVYEMFQLTDWRGGTAISGMEGNNRKVMPVNQYYIQNVECPIKFRPGAVELCEGSCNMSSDVYPVRGKNSSTSIQFIGITGSGSLFMMDDEDVSNDTWVRKSYDAVNDKQVYEINSSAKIGGISITCCELPWIGSKTLSSTDYVMPITNNMKIHLLSGSMYITQNLELAAGAEIEVDKEATAYVNSGVSLYVFDTDEWDVFETKNNSKTYPVRYTPSWTSCPRSVSNVPDAAINVHGKFIVNGNLYTTASGANLFSTNEDAGTVTYNSNVSTSSATIYVCNNTTQTYNAKTCYPAWLQNGEGITPAYSETAGTAAGKTWSYYDDKWQCWTQSGCFTYDAQNHPYIKPAAYVQVTSDQSDVNKLHHDAETGLRNFVWDEKCYWWEVVSEPTAEGYYRSINADHNGKYNYYYYDSAAACWKIKKITVTWNINGSTTDYSVGYGTKPEWLGATPSKSSSSSDYVWRWDGWTMGSDPTVLANNDLPFVTENTTFTAHFYEKYYEYNITFKNSDGTILESKNWRAGTTPSYDGTPTKNPTVDYTYEFNGSWSPAITTVTGSATYTAQYTQTPRAYTITFLNYDMSKLGTAEVVYNGTPSNATYLAAVAPVTEDPYKPDNSAFSFEFAGWRLQGASSNGFAQVKGDQSYIAQFAETTKKYRIEFVDEDGETLLHWTQLEYGQTPSYTWDNPANKQDVEWNYTFKEWNPSEFAVVEGPQTYTAVYNKTKREYTITWVDGNGETLKTEQVAYGTTPAYTGTTPTKTATAQYTYTFNNTWSPAIVAVTEAATYTAQFGSTVNEYTITWVDGNGETLKTEQVAYGTTPAYTGETPTKTATDQYTYTFNNTWSPAITSVTGAATYTAQFGSTVNKYTITWKNQDGEVLRTDENVEYGITPSYGSTPTLDPTTSTVYTFVQWNPEVVPVKENATYTADYSEAPRPYPVVWKNYNGDVLKESTRLWGWDAPAASTYDGVTPTKPGDANRTCVFSGWSDPVSEVAGGDVTYTAQFNVSMLVTETTPLTITSEETATTTTVKVSGKLDVTAGTLTTDELILEASENASGEIIMGIGNIVVPSSGNAYFDLAHAGGFKANTWYAIAVPWMVNVPAGGKGGVSIKKNGEYKSQKLGYDFDLIYYDGARRANGDVKAWNFLQDDPVSPAVGQHVMTPGVAYMIYLTEDAEAIRFQKRTSAPVYTEIVQVSPYESSNTTYGNWNGIANPATYHAFMNVLATENKGQVYVAETRQYKPFDMKGNKLLVGQPIFVQTGVSATTSIAVNGNSYPTLAPRRAKAQELLTRYELYLAPSQDVATDEIIVRMSEEKEENDYVVGQDLVKMGVSDLVPQLWIDRYDSKMYINTVAPEADNTADYPLGIFVPQSGEYDLFLDDELDSESNLYLTYDGEAIWNLSYGPYVASLSKGTDTHYGLRIVKKAPQTTTGIEETTIQNGEAIRKVLVNDKVYIIRNGQKYSVTGQKAK